MAEHNKSRMRGESTKNTQNQSPDRLLWLWRRGDRIPPVATRPDARFASAADDEELARAAGLPVDEVMARRQRGNRPYLARVGGELAAYGWACHWTAECGWKNLPFTVRDGDCYLWDFATLPPWRGNGLYPSLLAWILRHDDGAQHFWIMHRQSNEASRRGIARAGFQLVAALYDQPDGRFRLEPLGEPGAARLARVAFADLLTALPRGKAA